MGFERIAFLQYKSNLLRPLKKVILSCTEIYRPDRERIIQAGFFATLPDILKRSAMPRSAIAGIGMYVPAHIVTNNDMLEFMETSDEWIQERTGIKERRFARRTGETTTTMAVDAATIAIQRAGITPQDIDFIVFATLSPDYYFPGCGVLVQRAMKMKEIGALDIRNQCSPFVHIFPPNELNY